MAEPGLAMAGRLLIHLCCAHCAAYTVTHFRSEGYGVTGLWYNPNIHPFLEHEARRKAVVTLAEKMELPLITLPGYEMPEFLKRIAGNWEERCQHCFKMRLDKTAETARAEGFDAFTTTLLISPQQKHELIKITGELIAGEKGVSFLYADLRKRYSESRHLTKPLDLYRQSYCGCIFSEWERFRPKTS
ncbi:MAG: epoxyqueuosine reductase QueH [Chloroflexota bacterium]